MDIRVPFQAPSASVVRQELRSWLEDQGFTGERVDDARVVVSELVGNSVRHAAPLPVNDLVVSWSLEADDLVISVSDGGSASRPARGRRRQLRHLRPRPEHRRRPRQAVVGRGRPRSDDRARAHPALSAPRLSACSLQPHGQASTRQGTSAGSRDGDPGSRGGLAPPAVPVRLGPALPLLPRQRDRRSAAPGRPGPSRVWPSECDLVALRELVPAATAPLPLATPGERDVLLCTLLPMAAPAMVREDGTIWLGLQVQHSYGDHAP